MRLFLATAVRVLEPSVPLSTAAAAAMFPNYGLGLVMFDTSGTGT